MDPHHYALLADLLLILHASFILFVIGGQVAILLGALRRWTWIRNPAFRIAHLLAIGIVVAQAWAGAWCPLTLWEDALRRADGQPGYETSFIATWVSRAIYYEAPTWVFTLLYTAFGALILLTLWLVPPRRSMNK
ncbi:MAG TPA: DUF2784 domain-containing protein [Kiritimatiellia bacterium]|nr:DUF2784 domain-containing protein [Kiritimatiellia bacterium]